MSLRGLARLAVATTAACMASGAWAHGEIKGVGAFYSGVLHPFLSPAHLIALVALGLLFGQRGVLASGQAMAALVAATVLACGSASGFPACPSPTCCCWHWAC